MLWLPGVQQLPATEDGGAQDLSYPPRLVLHTTEGNGTVESLAAYYHGSTYWPHFTADLAGMHLAQHIPLNRGGRALSHTDATQTNDANCIQVEIIGHATDAPNWPASEIDWLGHALKPVLDALGIHRVAPKFLPYPASSGASPVRFGETTWRQFNGVCGHQHVPENDHGDPGAMDIARFLAATEGAKPLVDPRYNPPVEIPSGFSDYITYPAGNPTGVYVLGYQGHLYAFAVPGAGGVNGLPFMSGHHACRLDYPTAAEIAAHPTATVVIIRDDGARSVRGT